MNRKYIRAVSVAGFVASFCVFIMYGNDAIIRSSALIVALACSGIAVSLNGKNAQLTKIEREEAITQRSMADSLAFRSIMVACIAICAVSIGAIAYGVEAEWPMLAFAGSGFLGAMMVIYFLQSRR